MSDPAPRPDPIQTEWLVPWRTILKLWCAALLTFAAIQLGELFMLLFLAMLLAITLEPVVSWLVRRGWPRWVGVLVVAVGLFGTVVGFGGLVLPLVANQAVGLVKKLPELQEQALAKLPKNHFFYPLVEKSLTSSILSNPEPMLKQLFAWGQAAIQHLVEFFLVLILSLYLLLDGKRTMEWLMAFLPRSQRHKVRQASQEISPVVFSYVVGQAITSALCGIYTYVVLSLLHVPGALILALMAAVFDILPVIGFILSLIPACLLGASVSPATAIWVVVLYVFYHTLENYLIVPKVYGKSLRLSTLTVLISLLVATLLAGIPGAIAVLPVVAAYPIIERIWLADKLGSETLTRHADLEKTLDPDAKKVRTKKDVPQA